MTWVLLYASIIGGAAYYTPEPIFTSLPACEARAREMNAGRVGTWEYRCEERAR